MGRRDGRRSDPGWRIGLWPGALVAVVLVLVVTTFVALRGMRSAATEWDEVLDTEVLAVVEAERLAAASELAARVTRDAILTADPRAYRALGASQARVLDLLARARARVRTADEDALVSALEVDHARVRQLGEVLMELRIRGAPPGVLAERLEADVLPLRNRIDDTLARHAALHEARLQARRVEIGASERGATRALVGAAVAGVALALVLGHFLGRSLMALRGSEIRFRATFEQAAVGIAHVGLDGRWLRLNRAYLELLGRREDELRARGFAELLHPEDRASDAAQLDRLLRGEIDDYALEVRCLRSDGRAPWVNVTCAVVRDRAGRPDYFVRVAEDVTLRKKVERDLREAVRTRDEFLQVASHELRTPLSSLRLRVESLRASLGRGNPDPRRLEEKADAALRQTTRLASLLDGLLDVSRLSAEGRLRVEPSDEDLAEVAREVVSRVAPAAAREGTTVRLEAPRPVPARVDRGRVEQALGHLLSNALRYGVGRPVDVRVEGDGDLARVAVSDRGVGIEPADAERIFERFERAASWRHYGGLGIGLFLTRRIVEAHGGTVHAEGAKGAGATFVIELPRQGPPQEEHDDARRDADAGEERPPA